MDNAARAHQRVLVLFLPVAGVPYVSAEALNSQVTDRVITGMATAFTVLPIAARQQATTGAGRRARSSVRHSRQAKPDTSGFWAAIPEG